MSPRHCLLFIGLGLLVIRAPAVAETTGDSDISTQLDRHNVSWDVPGPTSAQSMPIGNGDIGLNVWVEPSGDISFYIGKTDAWNEDTYAEHALIKLGEVHVAMDPSPLVAGTPFAQVLKLHEGEIEIKEGAAGNSATLRVWVDANHPVIRVEAKCDHPVSLKVTQEDWRTTPQDSFNTERILTDQTNRIAWYHRNRASADPHIANLTTGAVIKGVNLLSKDAVTLESSAPATSHLVSIYPLTATTGTPDQWLAQLNEQISQIDTLDLEKTRQEHQKWWDQFWQRSWIFVQGDQDASDVTNGYILQRFVTACAGRGAYPIKFNGSIFVVDNPALPQGDNQPPKAVNADYRAWGGCYWYQNTRAMYWPRLQAGDFDEMLPLFKMYEEQMKVNAPIVKAYYGHDGSYFAEQWPFWGGLKYVGPQMPANWNDHYFTDILDLGMMMLDYYEYTGDKKFLKQTAIPMITNGLTFFREHFYLGPDGKLLLDPDNAIEMYWKVHDPAPDIAGLHAVLARMIALPDDFVDAPTRDAWKKLAQDLPDLPIGTKNDTKVLLPYTGEQTAAAHNGENPELYAIYPFRLYGLGKPDLQLAIDTFHARRCKQKGCWVQDPIQAAMLGLTDVAKSYVRYNLTRTDPRLKFPAFWVKGNDYEPDEDNGGNGENGLQQMLMQTDGKKIMLLPAWPDGWDADFKLNAPYQTTVQGSIVQGKLTHLVVTPPERKADVIDMSLSSALSLPVDRQVVNK